MSIVPCVCVCLLRCANAQIVYNNACATAVRIVCHCVRKRKTGIYANAVHLPNGNFTHTHIVKVTRACAETLINLSPSLHPSSASAWIVEDILYILFVSHTHTHTIHPWLHHIFYVIVYNSMMKFSAKSKIMILQRRRRHHSRKITMPPFNGLVSAHYNWLICRLLMCMHGWVLSETTMRVLLRTCAHAINVLYHFCTKAKACLHVEWRNIQFTSSQQRQQPKTCEYFWTHNNAHESILCAMWSHMYKNVRPQYTPERCAVIVANAAARLCDAWKWSLRHRHTNLVLIYHFFGCMVRSASATISATCWLPFE